MYRFVATLFVGCFIAFVWSETCPSGGISECIHTSCGNDAALHCIDGLCTCTVASQRNCTTRDECLALTNWNCRQQDRHCIDNVCSCIRLP